MTIMVSTVNMLAGLDELVHGDNDLHGWGGYTRPDPTLLFVRGFDPTTQSFTYAVNQRFGSTRGTANAFRVPFQLAVQARYVIGPDQNAERMRALFGAGGGRGGRDGGGGAGGEGAAANSEDLADRLQRVLPNPAAQLLELKDSLALTDSQVVKLTARPRFGGGGLRGDRGLDSRGRNEGGAERRSRAAVRDNASAAHEGARDVARHLAEGAGDSHAGAVGESARSNQELRGWTPRSGARRAREGRREDERRLLAERAHVYLRFAIEPRTARTRATAGSTPHSPRRSPDACRRLDRA